MGEQLHFSMDGEFLTAIARDWFWNMDKPYKKCEELLLSCVMGGNEEEKRHVCQDIIEGRKKLVGVNEFELVDDNVHVRSLGQKVEELQHKMLVNQIREDMIAHPLNYVDRFAMTDSYETLCTNAKHHYIDEAFADIENIEYQNVDTSQVTSAASAFSGMKKLTSIGGLENWNTSNITTMNRMCYQCEALQSIAGMEKWDTSKVTDMSEAFAGCLSLSDASPTDGWDTSSVTNKENMFAGALCEKAPEIANDTENTDTGADSSEGNSEQAESKAKTKEDEAETKTPDSENTQPDTSTAA